MLPFLFRRQGTADARLALLTNLDAWYKCDDVSGALVDVVAARNMTDNNTVGDAAGQFGRSRLYTATNSEYHNIAHAAWQAWTTNWSCAYWYYLNTSPGAMWHITKWNTGQTKFMIRSESNKNVCYIGSQEGHATTGIAINNWYYDVWVYDGAGATDADRLKLYHNGSPTALTFTGAIVSPMPSSTADLMVGVRAGSAAFYFDGRMDEIAFWSRSLTAADVAQYPLGSYPG